MLLPTALSRTAKWFEITDEPRRPAFVHAAVNIGALGLIAGSLRARGAAHRTLGVSPSLRSTAWRRSRGGSSRCAWHARAGAHWTIGRSVERRLHLHGCQTSGRRMDRYVRMVVPALGQDFLSGWAASERASRVLRPPVLDCGAQLFVLPPAGPKDVRALASVGAGRVFIRSQGQPLPDPYEEAQGTNRAAGAAAGPRRRTRRCVWPRTVSVSCPLGDRPRTLESLPRRTGGTSAASVRLRVPAPKLADRRRVRVTPPRRSGAVPADRLANPTRRAAHRGLDLCPLSRRRARHEIPVRRARSVGQADRALA